MMTTLLDFPKNSASLRNSEIHAHRHSVRVLLANFFSLSSSFFKRIFFFILPTHCYLVFTRLFTHNHNSRFVYECFSLKITWRDYAPSCVYYLLERRSKQNTVYTVIPSLTLVMVWCMDIVVINHHFMPGTTSYILSKVCQKYIWG